MPKISICKKLYDVNKARVNKNYSNEFTDGWEQVNVTWHELGGVISRYVWSPIIFKGGYRNKNNFIEATLGVLDFDDGTNTILGITNEWIDYKYLVGTTKSHQYDKGDGKLNDRFRLVFQYEETITNEKLYNEMQKKMAAEFGGDPKACDSARMFMPCTAIPTTKPFGLAIKVTRELVYVPERKKVLSFKRNWAHKRSLENLPKDVQQYATNGIPQGQRNAAVFRVACVLSERGYSYDEIVDLTGRMIRDRRDFSERELIGAVESALKTTRGT